VEPPPESEVEATAFEAGVAWGAGTKLHGAGVGEVVGTSRRLAGVGRTADAGIGVTAGDDVGATLTFGVG
jgi:hypothetical protein